jgi:hypothetical protein
MFLYYAFVTGNSYFEVRIITFAFQRLGDHIFCIFFVLIYVQRIGISG